MRRLKIGIRPQLIILVTFSSLFSLLILAVIIGVYYSSNLTDLRADRLEMIAELKTTQVQQSFDYLVYQVDWMTRRDVIYDPLISNQAGNDSSEVFSNSRTAIDQFLSSSDLFASAELYDLELNTVVTSQNPGVNVTEKVVDYLYPLKKNGTVPSSLFEGNSTYPPLYITGPVSNTSDADAEYFMGVTIPVYANTSIILENPTISGYLSVISRAQMIRYAISNAAAPYNRQSDYYVISVKPFRDGGEVTSFEAVFPLEEHGLEANRFYNINSSSAIKEAITEGDGSSFDVTDLDGSTVAISYDLVYIDSSTSWSVIVAQKKSVYLAPVVRLRNIIIGVVFGIGVFMCLITFPLTVWFIRPITKLKEATESITKSKKRRDPFNEKSAGPQSFEKQGSNNRDSVASGSTWTSAISSGIRLPSRIPKSKKLFKDELTELSDAFNIMTEELDKQYSHLEDRVKSRTKELEASKQEAEAANEAKTIFIANISHELRTPLNGILGMTSIAMAENDHTKIQDSLHLIHRSGELLLHILTELLTYSKNTLNRSKLEISNFQLLEIAYQIKSIFGKSASDQRVNFRILLKPKIIRKLVLLGDANRIIQIVMNLVSNSLKFTPIDGSVDVTFKMLGEYDYEKSKKCNFTKVCIRNKNEFQAKSMKKNHKPADVTKAPSTDNNKERSRTLSLKDHSRNSKVLNSNTSNEFSSLTNGTRSDHNQNDIDDQISVVTLSTTQYEKMIFDDQFQKQQNPGSESTETRRSSTRSSLKKELFDRDFKPSNESNQSDSLKGDSTYVKSDSDEGNSKEHTKSVMNGEVEVEEQTRQDSVNNDNKTSTIVGSDLEDLHSEVFKDSKVYPIKTFYHPKTWVMQIDVEDTGSGIEPALQEKVFEPFIQGDQSLSRSHGGTGLGLSICRQLATMMRGTMTLKSTLGVGSTFSLVVPLPQTGELVVSDDEMEEFCDDDFNIDSEISKKVHRESYGSSGGTNESCGQDSQGNNTEPKTANSGTSLSNGHATLPTNTNNTTIEVQDTSTDESTNNKKLITTKKSQSDLEKPSLCTRSSTGTAQKSTEKLAIQNTMLDELSNINILVAEDNMVNQEVVRRMLGLEGFKKITMACNGAEAIECIKESIASDSPYDLVFMDVQMPKVDGLLATRMIRQNLQFKKPIIALTAFADESNVKDCLGSGMSGFLSKPIRRNSLKKIITEFSPEILKEAISTPSPCSHENKQMGYSSPE